MDYIADAIAMMNYDQAKDYFLKYPRLFPKYGYVIPAGKKTALKNSRHFLTKFLAANPMMIKYASRRILNLTHDVSTMYYVPVYEAVRSDPRSIQYVYVGMREHPVITQALIEFFTKPYLYGNNKMSRKRMLTAVKPYLTKESQYATIESLIK